MQPTLAALLCCLWGCGSRTIDLGESRDAAPDVASADAISDAVEDDVSDAVEDDVSDAVEDDVSDAVVDRDFDAVSDRVPDSIWDVAPETTGPRWQVPTYSYPYNASKCVCNGDYAAVRDGKYAQCDLTTACTPFLEDGRLVSSCVRIQFAQKYTITQVKVVAAYADAPCLDGGEACVPPNCGKSRQYYVFVVDRSTTGYVFVAEQSNLTADPDFQEYTHFTPRSILTDTLLVCRPGVDYTYDDVLVDYGEVYGE